MSEEHDRLAKAETNLASALWNEFGHDVKLGKAMSAYGMARFSARVHIEFRKAVETLTPAPAQPEAAVNVVEAIADAAATAIASISVTYSHSKNSKFQTIHRLWSVHDSCEGNPFDRNEWLGQFESEEDANDFASALRRTRSIDAVKAVLAHPSQAKLDGMDEAAKVAVKSDFECGQYDDGSGAKVTVRYDTTPPSDPRADCCERIWVETGIGGNNWISFDYTDAGEVAEAILHAAACVPRALAQREQS